MPKRIKIKPSIYVLRESEDRYKFILTSSRKVLTFNVDSLVKEVINSLTEEKDYDSFRKELVSKGYSVEKIERCVGAMESGGILRILAHDNPDVKYSRQLEFLDEFTESYSETIKLHNKLRSSRIAVFGVGGIGSWIVNGLSQIGIGTLAICDPDKVELTNLNRQLFFQEQDIGRYKVDVLKDRLPDTRVETYKLFVSPSEDLEHIVQNTNFIVNCADSPSVQATSEIIDSYATRHNIPYLVSGGYNLHLGMIGPIIVPGKTLNFQDFSDYQKRKDRLSSLEKVKDIEATGNLGPIAGAVANIQVMEIFKYLTGIGKVNLNKFGEIDFMDLSISWNQFGPEVSLKD
jgi:molybdopterin/thiamine biosynthesis adenylyltransferase